MTVDAERNMPCRNLTEWAEKQPGAYLATIVTHVQDLDRWSHEILSAIYRNPTLKAALQRVRTYSLLAIYFKFDFL